VRAPSERRRREGSRGAEEVVACREVDPLVPDEECDLTFEDENVSSSL
jgi:hypothetical protein